MSGRLLRARGALAVTAVGLACAVSVVAVPAASASPGESTLCNLVPLPSATKTVDINGVAHATVYTCSDAQTPPFTQCAVHTVIVPDVVSLKLYLCLPPDIGFNQANDGGCVDDTAAFEEVAGVDLELCMPQSLEAVENPL